MESFTSQAQVPLCIIMENLVAEAKTTTKSLLEKAEPHMDDTPSTPILEVGRPYPRYRK